MTALAFLGLAVLLAVVSRLVAGRWHPGYLLGGLLFGIYNEFCFEFCWDYDPALGPMLWRDVPLVVLLGWGVQTMLVLSISNRLCAWRRITSRGLRALIDVALFVAVGFPNERLMLALGYWQNNFALQGTVWIQILGYAGVGLLVSSVGRAIESYVVRDGGNKR